MTRFDLYRDIHKGIRLAIFSFVGDLGTADLSSEETLSRVRVELDALVGLLEQHARHEDAHITPVLARVAPDLTDALVADHHSYDARLVSAARYFTAVCQATGALRAERAHELYLELSSFTGAYLAHMDREEREANGALWTAFDDARLLQLHGELLASIPPAELVPSMRWILRGTNVDERAAILAGIRATAPAPAFEGALGLARSVLSPADARALEIKLDLPPSSRAA